MGDATLLKLFRIRGNVSIVSMSGHPSPGIMPKLASDEVELANTCSQICLVKGSNFNRSVWISSNMLR